jgi:hypothetical protein
MHMYKFDESCMEAIVCDAGCAKVYSTRWERNNNGVDDGCDDDDNDDGEEVN